MIATFIDVAMVLLLLPVLFYMEATLAWTVLIACRLHRARHRGLPQSTLSYDGEVDPGGIGQGLDISREHLWHSHGEVALGLEASRAAEWDPRVAKVGDLNLQMGRLSNWPMVLVLPFEKFTRVRRARARRLYRDDLGQPAVARWLDRLHDVRRQAFPARW